MQGQAIPQVSRPVAPADGGGGLELAPVNAPPPADSQQTGILTKLLYTVAETQVLLSLSKTVLYAQLNTGRLRSVQQGRTRLIPAAAILEYVALLEREAAEPGTAGPSWSAGSGGGSAPRVDKFLRVHLWQSTGCHHQPWEL